MQNEKIIQAIAAYLERETIVTGVPGSKEIQFGGVLNQGHFTHAGFCKEVATDLAAAIAPHMEAATEYPYDELFDHMSNEHKLTLIQGELGDIIHIARGKSKQGQDPNFTEWLDRYFVKEDMVTRYRSKSAGAIYLEKEVLELYNRTK